MGAALASNPVGWVTAALIAANAIKLDKKLGMDLSMKNLFGG
jgi:hypothetical protein